MINATKVCILNSAKTNWTIILTQLFNVQVAEISTVLTMELVDHSLSRVPLTFIGSQYLEGEDLVTSNCSESESIYLDPNLVHLTGDELGSYGVIDECQEYWIGDGSCDDACRTA